VVEKVEPGYFARQQLLQPQTPVEPAADSREVAAK
jgi:hypothetical protein